MSNEVALYKLVEQSEINLCLYRQNGVFRADLCAYRTARTEVLVNGHLIPIQIHGRAGELVDAETMVLAFVEIYMEGPGPLSLTNGPRKKRAILPRYNNGNTIKCHGGLNRFDGLFHLKGLDHMEIFYPTASYHTFNGDSGPLNAQGFRIHPRVGLMACHGCGAVIQNHQCEFVVVVHGIDQSSDP